MSSTTLQKNVAANGGATLPTLIAARGTARALRWLGGWADVVSLD